MNLLLPPEPMTRLWPRRKTANGIVKKSINTNDYESIRSEIAIVRKQLFRQDGIVEVLACRWSEKDISDPYPIFSIDELSSYLNIRHSDQPSPTLDTHLFIIDQSNTKSCLDTSEQGMYLLLDHINAFPELGLALTTFAGGDAPIFEGRSDFYACMPIVPGSKHSVFELCVVLKYVELNGNKSSRVPWSIRQQLLYQRFDKNLSRQSIVLLRASAVMKSRIQEVFLESSGYPPHWTNLVTLAVFTLSTGWREYAKFLDLATWDVEKSANFTDPFMQSPGEANFKTLQATQMYHDLVTRAIHVLQTNISILALLSQETEKRRRLEEGADDEQYNLLSSVIKDVKQQLNANARHLKLVQVKLVRVTERVRDCITLRASQQSANEAKNMRNLALSANREARTVKAIAFVTLVYLPATFVATFLGMDYVKVTGTNSGGILGVSIQPTLWMFLALTAPLTLATLLAWWAWEWWNRKKKEIALWDKYSLA